MTQKDMEARLIALEAEYAQKKLEADAQIRREQKEIANAEANYHNVWTVPRGYVNHITLDKRLYPEVTFENSPMEVELTLKQAGSSREG